MSTMDDSAVMAVLKSSRKARKQTTCYPCQRRKVKCDRGLPCSVCVSRGHSFLCSYGRPTETSKTIPSPSNLAYTDGSGSQSQMSALREQLNHLHGELQHARKRHKQCEEAEDHVRRLQARCREYEDVHAKLRAGDWSALERINESVGSDSDTSSTGPGSSECSQDTRSRDGNGFGLPVDLSSTTDAAVTTTNTVNRAKRNSVSTAHPRESEMSAVTLSQTQQIGAPVYNIPNVQQQQAFFNQGGGIGGDCRPSEAIDGRTSYHYEWSFNSTSQSSVSNQPSYEYMLHQMSGSDLQQNQRTPPSAPSENRRENPAPRQSMAPATLLNESNQQQVGTQVLQSSDSIGESNMILSNPIPERIDTSSGVSWTQFSLFPPMIFGQNQEFMQRSYEDYWARIVVEAQRSTLLAG